MNSVMSPTHHTAFTIKALTFTTFLRISSFAKTGSSPFITLQTLLKYNLLFSDVSHIFLKTFHRLCWKFQHNQMFLTYSHYYHYSHFSLYIYSVIEV